jgi:hemoglobin
MNGSRRSMLLALALCGSGALPAAAQDTAAAQPTLYARLGGYDVVAKFVDTAFPRVASHPQLERLFQGHARDSQVRQRQLIVDALCQAAGGPCAYIGRPMRPVHEGLGITAADWSVFTGILGGALDEMKVRPAEKRELLALLETRFRPDVVDK